MPDKIGNAISSLRVDDVENPMLQSKSKAGRARKSVSTSSRVRVRSGEAHCQDSSPRSREMGDRQCPAASQCPHERKETVDNANVLLNLKPTASQSKPCV